MTDFVSAKPSSRSINFRDANKKDSFERRRCLLYLIANYLYDISYGTVASLLEKEALLDSQYQVCDNVDLEIILQEYQSYYYTKFQRQPKILKKLSETERSLRKCQTKGSGTKLKTKKSDDKDANQSTSESDTKFDFEIVSIGPNATAKVEHAKVEHALQLDKSLICYGEIGNTMSLADFEGYPAEWRELADLIMKNFVPNNLGITWQDCVGMESTIETLKEATIYPLRYPTLFQNIPSWKGILLFGPPGTGKTLLAKALACEYPGKFINVTSSSFISKWRGESEKMIKVLFEIARHYAPTTIFIDEIDALTSCSEEHNHEASRRFKSEFLVQIDGIIRSDEPIFILATTNFPWKLDLAMLRRFEKRIFVPLPTEETRAKIFNYYLNVRSQNNKPIDKDHLEHLAIITKNYSGSDIRTLCQEAHMIPVREKLKDIGNNKNRGQTNEHIRPMMMKDIKDAIIKVKPCTDINLCQKHTDWNSKYGSH